jgi:hypothetical protein
LISTVRAGGCGTGDAVAAVHHHLGTDPFIVAPGVFPVRRRLCSNASSDPRTGLARSRYRTA